ncbi:MAG: hypothetical protein EXR41_02115 [Candidatus Methylopumilus sp.]|nr:hypothetical protein [Candidatus Methylopumilus sp.]
MRLINSVLIITMMISFMSYQKIIETFYLIIKPLRFLGIDAKRFAVRLYLTMEYVKIFKSKHKLRFNYKDLSSLLLYSYDKTNIKNTHIVIQERKINFLSLMVIFMLLLSTFILIFYT